MSKKCSFQALEFTEKIYGKRYMMPIVYWCAATSSRKIEIVSEVVEPVLVLQSKWKRN